MNLINVHLSFFEKTDAGTKLKGLSRFFFKHLLI